MLRNVNLRSRSECQFALKLKNQVSLKRALHEDISGVNMELASAAFYLSSRSVFCCICKPWVGFQLSMRQGYLLTLLRRLTRRLKMHWISMLILEQHTYFTLENHTSIHKICDWEWWPHMTLSDVYTVPSALWLAIVFSHASQSRSLSCGVAKNKRQAQIVKIQKQQFFLRHNETWPMVFNL